MKSDHFLENIEITGYVKALEKDKGGHVIAVLIETDEFEKFIVHNGKTRELIAFLDRKIRVKCNIVDKDLYDNNIIQIDNYSFEG